MHKRLHIHMHVAEAAHRAARTIGQRGKREKASEHWCKQCQSPMFYKISVLLNKEGNASDVFVRKQGHTH